MKIKRRLFEELLIAERTKGFSDGFEAGAEYAISNDTTARIHVAYNRAKKSVAKALDEWKEVE